MTEDEELRRQSLLIQSLEHNEAFLLWRREVCDPMVDQVEYLLAGSDELSEPVLRANVKLKYLLKDVLYRMFDRVRAVNENERDLESQEAKPNN